MTGIDLRDLRLMEVRNAGDDHKLQWLYNQAWAMRLSPTRAETIMWGILNDMELEFYPQWVVRPYIVDFYLPAWEIIIEVDGSSHVGQEAKDARRERYLGKRGLGILRCRNQDLYDNPESIKYELWGWLR